MAQLLINTRGATEEEVTGMEAVLEERGIACYRTDAGRWRLGVDALWVTRDQDYDEARALVDQFQEAFSRERREHWQQLQAQGQAPTFIQHLLARPLKVGLALVAIVVVATISLLPFMGW